MKVRLVALGWCLLASGVGFGQTFGSIDGETRDFSGAIVAAVTVPVTNNGTNAVRTVVTNDAGVYSFPSLAPGIYTLRSEKMVFKTLAANVSTGFSPQGQATARQGGIRAGETISVGGQLTNFNHYRLDGVELTLQQLYTFGAAGRNTIIGPAGSYWDFSTHQSFRMPKDGHVLQFRWEAFNSELQRGEKCA